LLVCGTFSALAELRSRRRSFKCKFSIRRQVDRYEEFSRI
jgi:hypothetical protein